MSDSIFAKSKDFNGKAETLSEHTIRCIQIARVLLKNLPFDSILIERLNSDLILALAIHDVGKAAVGFQKSLEGIRWGHRHEILSASFGSTLKLNEEIILAVITHHKSIPSNGIDDIFKTLPEEEIPFEDEQTPIWKDLEVEWNQNVGLFSDEWRNICNEIGYKYDTNDLKLSPLYINKKWFHRGKQSKIIPFEKRYYASLLRGLLITSDHIASNSNLSKDTIPLYIPKYRDYEIMKTIKPRGFQMKTGTVTGNIILRAPTGSGKTIAALLWTQKNQGKNGRMFYVLPNLASINSMYLRLKKDFGDNVGLLHSRVASSIYSLREDDSDILSTKRNNQTIARTLSSLAREMWFPIRICTPHQIMRYSLNGKGWETMLSEFPNSCFIFDEIHAYDPLITGLVIATAKSLNKQNANCMFLSATLPSFLRKILEKEIDFISYLEPDFNDPTDRSILTQKRHELEIIDGDILSNIEFVKNEISKSNLKTLVVCNTIKSSQIIFDELKKHFHDIVLLHSQFNRKDRNRLEKRILEDLPQILVATQVVEVSLDIDFHQGFFEPAPIDALVQRLGRVNRYGSRSPAKVRIFRNKINAYNIYDKEIVEKSITELEKLPNPIDELDLISACDKVYGNGYEGDSKLIYETALNHPTINKFQDNLIAGTHHNWVDQIIDKMDNSIDLLPISLLNDYQKYREQGLKIEADLLLVPVGFRKLYQYTEFLDKNYLDDVWIIKTTYSEIKGLSFDSDDYEYYSNII